MEQITEKLYSIDATAEGGREGRSTSSDNAVDVELGKPGSGKANPETLFAAGYAACFNGALTMVAGKHDVDASEAKVTADVVFGKAGDGFGLAVDLVALVPGVDAETAQSLAEKAHQLCPYSKATRGNIEVTVSGRPAA